jgi:hypothetical protein
MPRRVIPIGRQTYKYDFSDDYGGLGDGIGSAIAAFARAPQERAAIEMQRDHQAGEQYDRQARIRIDQQRANDEHEYRMDLIRSRQDENVRKWAATIGTGLKGVLSPLFGMHHGSMTDAQRQHAIIELAKSRKAKEGFEAAPLNDQDLEDASYYLDHGSFPHRDTPAPAVPTAKPAPASDPLATANSLDPIGYVDPGAEAPDESFSPAMNPISAVTRGIGSMIFGKGANTSPPPVNPPAPVNASSPVPPPSAPDAAPAPVAAGGKVVPAAKFQAYVQAQSQKQGRPVSPQEAAKHLADQGFTVEGMP